jgi:hypothetical protein
LASSTSLALSQCS